MTKQKKLTPVKIELEFGEYRHCLWASSMKLAQNGEPNWIKESFEKYPGSYAHLEGPETLEYAYGYFFTTSDGYLNAKIAQAIFKAEGYESTLISDEYCSEEHDTAFVVLSDRPND